MLFTKLDDSPMFRSQLQALEESAEALRERSQKFYKGCRKYTEGLGEAYDEDIAFASALEMFGGGHNDPIGIAFGGPVMTKYTIALREIGTYKEVLRSQVEHILNERLIHFVNIDLHDVKEIRKRFDKASLHYDQAREKFLSLRKSTKMDIVAESEEELRIARSAFEQARFNLVSTLSNIEAKKKFEFLEAVSGTMDAHLRYFKQGYELLHQMEPYIHQVLAYAQQSRDRTNYEQAALAERMQEFKRQIDRESRCSFSDADNSPTGDGIQAVGRSSHKMIEAAMQSTAKGKIQTIRQGYLSKRSSNLRGDWKRRFFVLDSRGMLYYYRKQHWGKLCKQAGRMHMHANLSWASYAKTPERTCFATKADSRWQFNRCKYLPGKRVCQHLHIPILNGRRLSVRKHFLRANASDLKYEESSMKGTIEEELKNLAVLNADPSLASHKAHLQYRYTKYLQQKQAIEKHEGSLEEFSQGYLKYGFNRDGNDIVYREWAPAAREAQLIGDFNGWNGSDYQMEKDQFGVWSIYIPDKDGQPAIPHGSKVKIRMKTVDGIWVDRIPAWIRYATVDPSSFGAAYDGVYWDPPPSKRYEFKYPQPPRPEAPRIYEAHVGMSGPEPRVASYLEFAENVLPRIKANNYNTIQLMAVMEHSYYGSFGYHVTNFFAVSSRSGTPEDLKFLIDKAHSLGLHVLMDMVHSHAGNNVTDGLNGYDLGQRAEESYFHTGERGYHKLWDSRLFYYANWEVQRFLLSNLRWWLDEFHFDGFRFDGVTSMLYHHHGISVGFTGNYNEYFSEATDVDAVVYLMLANTLIHNIYPDATVIAEDVSGMPTLGLPVSEGGVGFDYRLAMAIPDKWIEYLKHKMDEQWSMKEIVSTLTNRRYTEKCVAYAESHDQSIVGDRTIAFLLMDKEMYFAMSCLQSPSPVVDRGIALHKMIHFITMSLGGEGYLNFMGNEFGHPEWIDFPRKENGWSYDKCRRQWDLVDTDHLRYKFMNNFDKAMNELDENFHFLASSKQIVSSANEQDKVIVFERGELVFVFNFHPKNTYSGYKIGCDTPGKYRAALDSDALEFGGYGRVSNDVDHFTSPEGIPGRPETNFNNRPNSMKIFLPSRSCLVYYRVPEIAVTTDDGNLVDKSVLV